LLAPPPGRFLFYAGRNLPQLPRDANAMAGIAESTIAAARLRAKQS